MTQQKRISLSHALEKMWRARTYVQEQQQTPWTKLTGSLLAEAAEHIRSALYPTE